MNVDKMQSDMRTAAEAALKQDAARVRTKIAARGSATLFDALESIGATMEDMWQGEWEGPIMFRDSKGANRLILVEQCDHDTFGTWLTQHPMWTDEELQNHGREALVRMCARPIDPKDYE